jgi:curved DNA-binding protein CbpA
MDYFELFGISETLTPDLKSLESKFFELSKKYHPDRVGGDEEIIARVCW